MNDVAALVLAAGLGRRFGDGPKMLARFRGEPFVRRAALAAIGGGAAPALVVTGSRGDAVAAALAGLPVRLVSNPRHADGLSTSLRAGFAALPDEAEAAVVLLGDMPLVGASLVRRLVEGWRQAGRPAALVPVHLGRRGNPVVLSRALSGDVEGLSGDVGAGPLLRGRPDVVELAVDDPAVALDVDTPEALAALDAQASTTSPRIAP